MLELLGAPGSPYTRKMIALLRYRRIAHRVHWGNHMHPPAGYPEPKVKLLPTLYFRTDDGGLEAAVDSTLLIRRLEREHAGRAALPDDPVLRFLSDLIEDYADEWLTKPMFHYRWAHEVDRENIAPLLIFWTDPTLDDATAAQMATAFTHRQCERLYVVGSNDITAQTIEESYARFVGLLDTLLARDGFVLGARPSAADFAIYGQLTQLGIVEPTPAALTRKCSPRVRAWLDRVEDLSGLPDDAAWFDADTALTALTPLLAEIGRVYLPFLLANAAAIRAGSDEVVAEIDGRPWQQPVFPYQAKCLAALRDAACALDAAARNKLAPVLETAGCGVLLEAGET